MKHKGPKQHLYQIMILKEEKPITCPVSTEAEAFKALEEKIQQGWDERSLRIASLTKREIYYSNFKTSRTYARVENPMSPRLKRKLRRLKRRTLKQALNDPQSQLDYLTSFVLGCKRLGMEESLAEVEFNKFIRKLREDGYSSKVIDKMVCRASNKYKFGFEVPRITHKAIF